MRNTSISIFITLVLATVVACSNPAANDNDNEVPNSTEGGTLTVTGAEYELTKLYIDHEGFSSFDNNYRIDVYVFSENMNYTGSARQGSLEGHGIDIRMNVPTDDLASGSFSYDGSDNDNTFTGQAFVGPNGYQEEFSGGTLEITVEGSIYTIETQSIPVANGDSVSFTYTGGVTEEFEATP